MKYIMGLDLSLTHSGIVVIPAEGAVSNLKKVVQTWAGSEMRNTTLEKEQQRLLDICRTIEGTLSHYDVSYVGFEQIPFNKFLVGQVITLAQLCGVVYGWLLKLKETTHSGLTVMPVNIKSARKHLFAGQIPQITKVCKKGKRAGQLMRVAYNYPKEDVVKYFKSIGMEFDSEDTMDAFVVANYIRGEVLGKTSLTKAMKIV